MAYQNKPKGKEQEKKGNAPDFTLRARQEPNSDYFIQLGVAWRIEVNGKEAFSIKMHSIPTNWDGSALMLMPKED